MVPNLTPESHLISNNGNTPCRYEPPPSFKALDNPSLDGKELWLVQIPPGVRCNSDCRISRASEGSVEHSPFLLQVDPKELAGLKIRLKDSRAVGVSNNTELFVQKKCPGHAVTGPGQITPFAGQITVRHKIEIPLSSEIRPLPKPPAIPEGLKYRL